MGKEMRVPRFLGEGQIRFENRPVPQPGPGELLIRVRANALCGSDRGQFLKGSNVTPGHEASGVVAVAGPGTTVAVGTPGVIFLMDFCGQCRSCRLGRTNQCSAKRADMGFSHDGGYGVYELIHENIFFPIDPELSLTDATLLLDIMGTGGHSINQARKVHPDIQSIAVLGAGPIGLGVLAMIKLLLGKEIPVIISDVVDTRLNLAEELGGIPAAVHERPLKECIARAGLPGTDVVIDTSGQTRALHAGMEALNPRGVFVCVGHGGSLALDVSPQLIAGERAVLGSEYFCFNELAENHQRLLENLSYLRKIITHRFPLEDIQKAYELFLSSRTGKVVVEQ